MAAGLNRHNLEQLPPKERYEKAPTSMAEARAKKPRAGKKKTTCQGSSGSVSKGDSTGAGCRGR
eukprot:5876488-Lingulodinium_polyedra.AAC.1